MSQLTAVDISDSDRFELAEVLKEESESSSVPRPLEDILQETCDDERAIRTRFGSPASRILSGFV